MGTKSGGRALELIIESILKSKMQKPNNFDYEFVDWKEIDYFIIDKKINDWVMGIQCKMALHTTKGYLNYEQVLKKLKAFARGFGIKKTLVIVCGVAVGYRGQDYTQQKEQIRQTFEKEGWKFYYLFNNDVDYLVDNSFYDFINLIESYV